MKSYINLWIKMGWIQHAHTVQCDIVWLTEDFMSHAAKASDFLGLSYTAAAPIH